MRHSCVFSCVFFVRYPAAILAFESGVLLLVIPTAPPPRAGIFLFDGPGGTMGIGFFFFWRWDFFSARKRDFLGCFFGVFLVFLLFFGGVFVLFGVLFCFSRVSAKFFWLFFPRGREQNREFPLCRPPLGRSNSARRGRVCD